MSYVPSAWDLPWQERASINAMYAEMAQEMELESMTPIEMVNEFHQKHGIVSDPEVSNRATKELRISLIQEELEELAVALINKDIVEVADAIGDILYVTYGAAAVYDIDIDRVFREIHRSNMTKVSDGGQNEKIHKIMKGPEYSPPDLSFVKDGRSGA